MIKIMLADDQQLVREALAALLGLEHDIEVVAQVGGGDEVIPAINRYHPDVVLLDIEMPGSELSSGIDVAAAIRDAKLVTLTGEPVRSLIVTTFGRPGYLRRALAAGASGFMVKDTSASQLAEGIRRVHAGMHVVDPALAAESLAYGESPLTERETEILRVAGHGATARAIGEQLFLSPGTVRNHLSSAMAKLNASNRQEAIRIASCRFEALSFAIAEDRWLRTVPGERNSCSPIARAVAP